MKKRIKQAGVTIKLNFNKKLGVGSFEAHGRKIASVGAGAADDLVLDALKSAHESAAKNNEKALLFEMQVALMLAIELKEYLSQSTISIMDEHFDALSEDAELGELPQ